MSRVGSTTGSSGSRPSKRAMSICPARGLARVPAAALDCAASRGQDPGRVL